MREEDGEREERVERGSGTVYMGTCLFMYMGMLLLNRLVGDKIYYMGDKNAVAQSFARHSDVSNKIRFRHRPQ